MYQNLESNHKSEVQSNIHSIIVSGLLVLMTQSDWGHDILATRDTSRLAETRPAVAREISGMRLGPRRFDGPRGFDVARYLDQLVEQVAPILFYHALHHLRREKIGKMYRRNCYMAATDLHQLRITSQDRQQIPAHRAA